MQKISCMYSFVDYIVTADPPGDVSRESFAQIGFIDHKRNLYDSRISCVQTIDYQEKNCLATPFSAADLPSFYRRPLYRRSDILFSYLFLTNPNLLIYVEVL